MACPGEPASGFTAAYRTALRVELHKRWPTIERIHKKAERRRLDQGVPGPRGRRRTLEYREVIAGQHKGTRE